MLPDRQRKHKELKRKILSSTNVFLACFTNKIFPVLEDKEEILKGSISIFTEQAMKF